MTNSNTKLLRIKDKNIKVEEGFELLEENGQEYFLFKGSLSYDEKNCPCCKRKTDNIIKDGFSKPVRIPMLKISELPTYLDLKKQRFICKECNHKFTATTSLVRSRSNISINVRLVVLSNLSEILSFKQIAEMK